MVMEFSDLRQKKIHFRPNYILSSNSVCNRIVILSGYKKTNQSIKLCKHNRIQRGKGRLPTSLCCSRSGLKPELESFSRRFCIYLKLYTGERNVENLQWNVWKNMKFIKIHYLVPKISKLFCRHCSSLETTHYCLPLYHSTYKPLVKS